MTSPLQFDGTPNLLELAEAGARAGSFGELSVCGDEVFSRNLVDLSLCGDEGNDLIRPIDLSPCGDEGAGNPLLIDLSPCADDPKLFTDLSLCGDDPKLFTDISSCADEGGISDIRLKTDIEQVGTTVYGLPLYHFRYKTGTERFQGVMAQDVLQVLPDAVLVGEDGYYRVKYADLGISMTRA